MLQVTVMMIETKALVVLCALCCFLQDSLGNVIAKGMYFWFSLAL